MNLSFCIMRVCPHKPAGEGRRDPADESVDDRKHIKGVKNVEGVKHVVRVAALITFFTPHHLHPALSEVSLALSGLDWEEILPGLTQICCASSDKGRAGMLNRKFHYHKLERICYADP